MKILIDLEDVWFEGDINLEDGNTKIVFEAWDSMKTNWATARNRERHKDGVRRERS